MTAADSSLPRFLARRVLPAGDALRQAVTSGTRIASGLATAEPHSFYAALWDHVRAEDLTDIEIRQALFMAPHPLLVGGALEPLAALRAGGGGSASMLGALRRGLGELVAKAESLRALIGHYEELAERRIRFVSGFMSPVTNTVIPDNALIRTLYPDWAGRNLARSGILAWQPVHLSDAPEALLLGDDGEPEVDLLVLVMTPPDAAGELSHGVANGSSADALEIALAHDRMKILLYLNPGYPFTRGHSESPNTVAAERLRYAAERGRLLVVEDAAPVPALPAGAFDEPSAAERAIASHVVNHMELHPGLTRGRALQVGIGGTGVLAVRNLASSSWRGRSYTEMLEPFTLELWERERITGSHFVLADGRREELDGKLVCTFALGVEGDGFYAKLDRHPAVLLSAASRVVVSEAFYGGLGINNILGIDFHGHVNASGRDRNPYSGVGGAARILRGLGRGGVAYLCLKSTHRTPEGDVRSSIFPYLPAGTPVTLVGPDLMGTRDGAAFFLVTEHGVAPLHRRSQHGLVRSLIAVAHPDHRVELARAAWEELRVSVPVG